MEQGLYILLFVVFSLVAGALLRHLLKGTSVPYTVALLLLGLLLGYLVQEPWPQQHLTEFSGAVSYVSQIEPHLILFLFLPALVFESAFAQEVHLFKRMLPQIALLAVPGLIITTVLTALLVLYALPLEWGWAAALMFGALISATDPVAVVALLKEQSSRKRLETLIEGESLLNDGTAIVLFVLFYAMVISGESSADPGPLTIEFIRVVSLGIISGLVVAALVLYWVNKVFNDALLETVVTIAAAYLVFIIAEHGLHASGVVAVVTMAIVCAGAGRTRFSPEVTHFLHHFWEMLAYMFNTLIFLLVGIIIAREVALPGWQMWVSLLGLYLAVITIRGATIFFLSPLLSRLGVGLTKEKAIVLTWGGLRGAVSLALALTVAQEEQIPAEIRQPVLFFAAGLVVLTIVVNGGTMSALLRKLGLSELPLAKQATVKKAETLIQAEVEKLEKTLREDAFFAHVDWPSIEQNLKAQQMSSTFAQQSESAANLDTFYKRQLLESERQHYWNQFNQGLLSQRATNILVEAVEQALDGIPSLKLVARQQLDDLWQQRQSRLSMIAAGSGSEFLNLVNAYASMRGFLQAQRFLLSLVESLAPDEKLAEEARSCILNNLEETEKQVARFKQQNADTVQKLESYGVMRLLLNKKRETIHMLEKQGVLEPAESQKLIERVEQEMFKLRQGK